MEASEPIVRRRRVRQFRTTEEKRLIVEETRRVGVSVSSVAQAHGINANQVFYWRKLYEAGQLESTVAQPTGDLGARGVRLLSVSVDEGAETQAPVAAVASTAEYTAGSDVLPGTIELTLARGQVRIAGTVDAGTLRAVLRCLLA
jgi:transposase